MSEQRYCLYSDKVVAKVLDFEAVIINLETGLYYGLDGVAATVWERLEAGIAQGDIASDLAARFPGSASESGAGIDALTARLVEEKLLAPIKDDAVTPDTAADLAPWPDAYSALELTCYDDVAEMVALDPPLPELDYGSEA